MDFRENLRELRQAAGFTLKDVGDMMGISGNTVGGWERGGREPSIKQIKKLTQCYRVDYNTLFGNGDITPTAKLDVMAQTIFQNEYLMEIFNATNNLSEESLEALAKIAKQLK